MPRDKGAMLGQLCVQCSGARQEGGWGAAQTTVGIFEIKLAQVQHFWSDFEVPCESFQWFSAQAAQTFRDSVVNHDVRLGYFFRTFLSLVL